MMLCTASLPPRHCRHVRRPPRLCALGFADVWEQGAMGNLQIAPWKIGAKVNGHWRPQQRYWVRRKVRNV